MAFLFALLPLLASFYGCYAQPHASETTWLPASVSNGSLFIEQLTDPELPVNALSIFFGSDTISKAIEAKNSVQLQRSLDFLQTSIGDISTVLYNFKEMKIQQSTDITVSPSFDIQYGFDVLSRTSNFLSLFYDAFVPYHPPEVSYDVQAQQMKKDLYPIEEVLDILQTAYHWYYSIFRQRISVTDPEILIFFSRLTANEVDFTKLFEINQPLTVLPLERSYQRANFAPISFSAQEGWHMTLLHFLEFVRAGRNIFDPETPMNDYVNRLQPRDDSPYMTQQMINAPIMNQSVNAGIQTWLNAREDKSKKQTERLYQVQEILDVLFKTMDLKQTSRMALKSVKNYGDHMEKFYKDFESLTSSLDALENNCKITQIFDLTGGEEASVPTFDQVRGTCDSINNYIFQNSSQLSFASEKDLQRIHYYKRVYAALVNERASQLKKDIFVPFSAFAQIDMQKQNVAANFDVNKGKAIYNLLRLRDALVSQSPSSTRQSIAMVAVGIQYVIELGRYVNVLPSKIEEFVKTEEETLLKLVDMFHSKSPVKM